MSGLGNLVTTKIITKGLGCEFPLDSGNITTYFGLYCKVVVIPPRIFTNIGGSIPLAPGEIVNFYKPVFDRVPNNFIPNRYVDDLLRPNYIVTIMIDNTEQIYKVTPKTGKMVVFVLNLVNSIKEKFKITINKVKVKRMPITIENLKKSLFK